MAEKKKKQSAVKIEGNTSNKKDERKTDPAGQGESWRMTYANFGSNEKELKANGQDFDNKALLELLGFKENAQGEMTLSAASHDVKRDAKGKVIKRTSQGKTLTEDRQSEETR